MSDTLIRVEGVSKKFCRSLKKSLWYGMQDLGRELTGRKHGGDGELRPDEFWAVNDVSFELKRGECLGLIGRNGAGKTTLLRMLNGLIKPDAGRIEMRGRVGALIALGAGFNPILTGRENIYVNASVLGLTKQEIDSKLDEIIDFAEISEFIDMPVQSYSSGMSVRLGFSIATTIKPDILFLDEVFAVGDADFQAKCFNKIGTLLTHCAVILVSHQAHHIKKNCNRAVLLTKGRFHILGTPDDVLKIYRSGQTGAPKKTLQLMANGVYEAGLSCHTSTVSTGESLCVELNFRASEQIECSQSYMNLVDSADVVHAQVQLHCLCAKYESGLTKIIFKIGPLYLSAGKYSVNFTMYSHGGKSTLIHLRRAFAFEFEGPTNLGAVYYPPAYSESVVSGSENDLPASQIIYG